MKVSWFCGRMGARLGAALVALVLAVGSPALVSAEARVDLNEATVEELTSLPGIGPARARAIVERREEAPFESVDELTDVSGIGPALVDKMRDQVEVADPERRAKTDTRR